MLNRKLLAITITGLVMISTAILTLHPTSPLKADTSYTVTIHAYSDVYKQPSYIATFWQTDQLKAYCIAPAGQTGHATLKAGLYNIKIYHEETGRFKEAFDIFVCKDLTITINYW